MKLILGTRPLGLFLTPLVKNLASRHEGHSAWHELVAQHLGNCLHSTRDSHTAARDSATSTSTAMERTLAIFSDLISGKKKNH